MKVFQSFILVLILALMAFAQTSPVEITGGRMYVTRTPSMGNVQIQTAAFTATGIVEWSLTPFEISCQTETECKPGRTLSIPGTSYLYLGDTYFRGGSNTFIINGMTYQNVYFEGETILSRVEFFIPKTLAYRKKGVVSLRNSFTYSTQMRVCQISMFNAPCPADKLLFEGNLNGHGTL